MAAKTAFAPAPTAHELACVVLSLRNERGLVPAVQSLMAQDTPSEIVVVNSGGGNPEGTLRQAGLRTTVITRDERLNPGAVRNLGIAATHAPCVAFLAADCMAEPGWVSGRLRQHRSGALAVASAVTNAHPHSYCAWASYMLLFARRVPGPIVPRHDRLLYGASYARELFHHYGQFQEDLRTGEDTEFHERFGGSVPIAWAPDVRTAHRHPTGVGALMLDQYVRGVRMAQAKARIWGRPHGWTVTRETIRSLPRHLKYAWFGAGPEHRPQLAAACLLVPPAVLAYVFGALLSDRKNFAQLIGRPRTGLGKRGDTA